MPEIPRIETDLYAVLNVARDASPAQLRSAYRKLSQVYHPDKHKDPNSRSAAQERFTVIKEAYEILIDAKLRSIYDEFGLDNAREAAAPVNELIPYDDLVEKFREDARERQASTRPMSQSAAGFGAQRRQRDAYFNVVNQVTSSVDGTGLVCALEDYDTSIPLLVVSQISLSSSATAYVTQKTTMFAEYTTLAMRDIVKETRLGIGSLLVGARHHISQHSNAEVSSQFRIEEPTNPVLTFQATRYLNKNTHLVFKSVFDVERTEASTMLVLGRTFDSRHIGMLQLATGSYPNYRFEWNRLAREECDTELQDASYSDDDTDDEETQTSSHELTVTQQRIRNLRKMMYYLVEPCRVQVAISYSGLAEGSFYVRRRVGASYPLFEPSEDGDPLKMEPSIFTRLKAGYMGWDVRVGASMGHLMSATHWGVSVSCGRHGVIWRFEFERAGHRLSLPIVLVSNSADAKAATVAAFTTSLLFTAVQSLIINPIVRMQEAKEKAEAREQRMDALRESKENAEAAIALSVNHVQTIRNTESAVEIDGVKQAGLLVERAVYGIKSVVKRVRLRDPSFAGSEIEKEAVEVGDCVQALVENSYVQVVSSTKCTLMGFWDPSATGDRDQLVLKVWYKFKAVTHECIVKDMQPLELPLSSHRVAAWS